MKGTWEIEYDVPSKKNRKSIAIVESANSFIYSGICLCSTKDGYATQLFISCRFVSKQDKQNVIIFIGLSSIFAFT